MSKKASMKLAAAPKGGGKNAAIVKSIARPMAKMNVNKSSGPKQVHNMSAQSGGQRKIHEMPEFDSTKADNNLKKKSPWYSSCRDPIQGGGAKIPDTVGINTATLQMVQKITVPVNAQGLAALEIVSPYANSVAGGGGQNYKTSATTSSSATLTWNSPLSFSSAASVKAVAQSHRVVSAAVYGEYEGTTLQDSGDVTAYLTTFSGNALLQLSAIQSLYGSSVVPVNKARTKPVCSRWFPIQVNQFSYKDFIAPTFTAFGNGGCPQWVNGLIYNGLPASVGSILFTIVVNYEFIPTLNSIDYISADPSPIDPIEEQLVQQWIQEDTQTGLTSNKLVDVQPGTQVVEAANQGLNSESGFGMLGGIIKEMAPMILPLLL